MNIIKTRYNRRSFLKKSALTGGGFALGFSWLASCDRTEEEVMAMPEEWFEVNAYLKIGDNGLVTILSPNPEFGQNVMTSMPMIVAEELDVAWEKVLVEQAPFNQDLFGFQFSGGSRGIWTRWEPLRMVGATARHMLKQAAANTWNVPLAEITTNEGVLYHEKTGQSAGYETMANLAAGVPVPEEVQLKEVKDFKIVGHSKKNVKGKEIVTGKPMFGVDYKPEGTLIAMVEHPPAFGLKLKSVDDTSAKTMPGIKDIFTIQTYDAQSVKSGFNTTAFHDLVVVVGNTTWEVMNAKKALKFEWEPIEDSAHIVKGFGGGEKTVHIPAGLENSTEHIANMESLGTKLAKVSRRDGDPEKAFNKAAKVIERTYSAPFLAHNCMEPINFYAHVTDEKVALAGPLQAPELAERTLSARLNMPIEKIDIHMTRMGGGFGRRAYDHYCLEAALISQKAKAPIQMVYTREDDMSFGIYRPTYHATYRAALDENNNLIAFHVRAGGIPESPLFANRFPAGALDNYLAEEWSIDSNITIGAFRAPRSNFMAGVEQSFLDEVAEAAGKDPIEFRLELLERAEKDPVGENNDYDPSRYAGVLKLVKEKSGWDNQPHNKNRGVSAYFCHNSYVAHVLDLEIDNGKPVVENVCCAIDCGIVVNPDAAKNMAEGAIVDGIGNALYGNLTFKDGSTEQKNFDKYRMIRYSEAPKSIDVHFVQNEIAPTGMGEPPFPPIFGALANALYKATGKRYSQQPFLGDKKVLG